MALQDWLTNVQLLLRWLHVLFGIIWLGNLYFLNFAFRPFLLAADPETKRNVHSGLVPRVLWWFRWAAMMTWILGLLLFFLLYTYPTTGNLLDENGFTPRGIWILFGAILGTVMWFNVWFILWPAQKKLIAAAAAGEPPNANLASRATATSRVNTYLSGPMLFGMLAANHYGAFNWSTGITAIVLAGILVWGFYRIAPKVGF